MFYTSSLSLSPSSLSVCRYIDNTEVADHWDVNYVGDESGLVYLWKFDELHARETGKTLGKMHVFLPVREAELVATMPVTVER